MPKQTPKYLISRRKILQLIGSAGATVMMGWADKATGFWPVARLGSEIKESSPACVVRPEQTEGPFFVNEKLNRSDIRTDPKTNRVEAGLPLRLRINVNRINGDNCTPLAGAFVDIWQCDSAGSYSDVKDGSTNTRGHKFLRGYQVTDSNGSVEFQTIYPGWYGGRTVHVHFKIRLFTGTRKTYDFTSQLYFDDAITDKVHAQAPYAANGSRDTRNDNDDIFSDGGSQLILNLVPDGQGYAANFDIGLEGTTRQKQR